MGLFDWAMKGVDVERRKNRAAPTAVVLEQPEIPQPLAAAPQQEETRNEPPTFQQQANSILFGDQFAAPPQYSAPTGFSSAFGGAALGNRNILVITPRSNQEVSGIVEHLRTGEACIVTLEGLPVSEAQRRIDFLSGVVCALNGTIKPLDANKYILTPSGVGVKN